MLSVCLITYNHVNYVEQAIEGVLQQKVDFSWELIIADDCSTDGTREIVINYQKKYPNSIKLILQEKNVGAAQNWIDLITCPDSKYIAYFEGDDYWTDPLKLQKQVDFLEKNPAIVCHCHNAKIWENGKLTEDYNSMFFPRELSRRDVITSSGIPTASVTFRNVFKDKMPDYLLNSSMDIILYFSLASHGNFYMSNEFMSVYRLHPGGIWSGQDQQLRKKKLIDLFNYILKYLPLDENERNDIYGNITQIKQQRIKLYSDKFHFGFTYFKDVFYLIGAKLKGRNINFNYLLYLMCPGSITSIFSRRKK